MLYASKPLMSVKTSDREGFLGAIEQSTLPLQNTVGVSLLLVLLWGGLGAIAYQYWQLRKTRQLLKIERLKTNELGKKLKLALHTIDENERNPDLIHSRDFNLDYLSMRMEEPNFSEIILAQIKLNLRQKVAPALMPSEEDSGNARKVDVVFDVAYQPENHDNSQIRTLFRIHVKLAKIPANGSQSILKELMAGLESFVVASDENRNWQPTIQGRLAVISWDQSAKPTPLLVIEQTNEGKNVLMRNKRLAQSKI
ncbi:hypothetical protein PseudUWO311_06180 [Pseudanabaena sp. UWO311]|uniref:hypothetical protein n=1 Tax=Pseudanabaena sp. UWO311 TaxID=2487337 RepID=UPI0011593C6A|nr:hypothetical protein [Pseudanabaena sp. UWO311]TYQ28016.1 hypothetical protein PseudUWO311_06180 [Pseudanabaena sp. UWO311]